MQHKNLRGFPLFAFLLLFVGCSPSTESPASAAADSAAATPATAAVAMPDRYAAEVSEEILKKGGNAVDAAVAAGFVLAVTYPEAGNIGGGGFMLIRMNKEMSFLDYRETAPSAADRDMYLDEDGNVIEGASLVGAKAAGVPGTVAGFWAAHQRYGKLPWKDLVTPAIKLAEEGFLVPEDLGGGMLTMKEWFGKTNFGRYFGEMKTGETFRQRELGATLRRISEHGTDGFYAGETAELIVAQMKRGGGLISSEDLADYKAVWREPLRAKWRDYEIVSAPLPSSGGFAVIQLLKIKDYLGHEFEGLAHNSPQYIHLVAEIEKRVFADRAEYLGDPDFVDTRMDQLLSDDYMMQRAQEVDPEHISMNVSAGPVAPESPDTTHFSILDQWGNAVSNTYTLNISFGSGVVVEGAGFLLNDEMDDFSVKPGVPNAYGVTGSEANEIQPGKRMLSSMSPTMLLKDGQVALVAGTPGGTTIFTSVFQTIVNIIDFGMTPAEAVGATRFHHQLTPPDLITYSPSRPLPPETISALSDRGYRVVPHDWEFGDMQIIWRGKNGLDPASDPRNRGESRVFTVTAENPASH